MEHRNTPRAPRRPPRRPDTRRTPAAPRRSRGGVLRFAAVFTILATLGSVTELYLQRFQMRTHRGVAYQRFIADVIGTTLHFADVPASVSDTTIRINGGSVEVAVECTGIKAMAIFCAGVLAFPCSWRRRAVGLIIGLFGVAALNTGRITALALVSGYRNDWFDQVHGFLMQGFLILFVAPIWIAWMLFAIRRAQFPTSNANGSPPAGDVAPPVPH